MTSSKFDVLVKEKDTLGWEWGSAPSGKAVRCDLEESEGGDCFLGQGVYSDGICEEVSTKKLGGEISSWAPPTLTSYIYLCFDAQKL